MTTSLRKIKMSELVKNNGEDGNRLWVLIENKIYDVTDFSHPGGNEILMDEHGTDRIDEFESIHSPAAKKKMKNFVIGELDTSVESSGTVTDKKTDEMKTVYKNTSSYFGYLLIFVFVLALLVWRFR